MFLRLLVGALCLLYFVVPYDVTIAQEGVAAGMPRQSLPVVFAIDGVPLQAAIDFYKEVYKGLARSTRWEPMPINAVRNNLNSRGGDRLGGLPTIDRQDFRSKLPRKRKRAKPGDGQLSRVIPGKSVSQLQRFLDNTRSPAVLIVDCARMSSTLLKACGLYYYDRVSARVIASAVKEFISGASDVTNWADPMLKTLESGLESAQHEKDQELIQELVARNEQDDVEQTRGIVALYVKGERVHLSSGFKQSISGFGLQLGVIDDTVGAIADAGILSWRGDGEQFKTALRQHYGINMLLRARALESLLWFLELGGGREKTVYEGAKYEARLGSNGLYAGISPGVGVELNDYFSLNLALHWRWFFESSIDRTAVSSDLAQTESRIPGVSLRSLFVF